MEISARFVEQGERFEETEYHAISNDVGTIYLPIKGMRYSNVLTFGLAKFLWMPRITVRGAHA